MLGDTGAYDQIPYFFSDQYDVGMEYSGYRPSWDQVVFRGDRDGASSSPSGSPTDASWGA